VPQRERKRAQQQAEQAGQRESPQAIAPS